MLKKDFSKKIPGLDTFPGLKQIPGLSRTAGHTEMCWLQKNVMLKIYNQ